MLSQIKAMIVKLEAFKEKAEEYADSESEKMPARQSCVRFGGRSAAGGSIGWWLRRVFQLASAV